LIRRWLSHPACRDLDVDDVQTTILRRQIIRGKGLLRRIYLEWYGMIAAKLPPGEGDVLEIGSGGGFLPEVIPGAITSDVLPVPDVDVLLDGRSLGFADGRLKAIVMTDVLHHLPSVESFLDEAVRCLRPGGRVIMVEPWNTAFSRLVYQRLHPEPFRPDAAEWGFPETGPLSGANGALPWILFVRDRQRFLERFPGLSIRSIQPFMPFRYLLSGGVSMRSLAPGWSCAFWRGLEATLVPLMDKLAMFALICLQRVQAEEEYEE
jgi:SAM-dependent methyltransferase